MLVLVLVLLLLLLLLLVLVLVLVLLLLLWSWLLLLLLLFGMPMCWKVAKLMVGNAKLSSHGLKKRNREEWLKHCDNVFPKQMEEGHGPNFFWLLWSYR